LSRTVPDVRRVGGRRQPSESELAALGEAAVEAIHELNNPLTVIAGLARLLLERRGKPPTRAELRSIENHASRACQIIHHAFGHRNARPTGDLNRALMRAVRAAGFTREQVKAHLASGLPPVAAFPDELESVFVNVLLNARRAMKAGPRQEVTLRTSLRQGKIRATIADSGPGIPRDQLPKIFERFHSRTPDGTGIGLGLFIARRILERRGGAVAARSGRARAVFSIAVPVARRASTRATGQGR
jgi:signal transduction histidine kinase